MFSIITITYNNLDGLKKTAESIEAQTCRDFEWIIVDGGSNDGSKEYLPRLSAITLSEPDKGIYDAMNKGINLAGQDYLLFLNAGDTLADTNTLQRVCDNIHRGNFPDFFYGPSWEERPGSEPVLKTARPVKYLFWGMPTHHQAMLYKRAAVGNLRYDLSYQISADYDFTCRFLKQSKTVHMTETPICLFEPGGISQQAVKLGRQEQLAIRKALHIVPPGCNHLIYLLQSAVMRLRQISPEVYWLVRGKRPA